MNKARESHQRCIQMLSRLITSHAFPILQFKRQLTGDFRGVLIVRGKSLHTHNKLQVVDKRRNELSVSRTINPSRYANGLWLSYFKL